MNNLKNQTLETKRFVIRKSLIGKNYVITFVNKKQEKVSYNHDDLKQWTALLSTNLIQIQIVCQVFAEIYK